MAGALGAQAQLADRPPKPMNLRRYQPFCTRARRASRAALTALGQSPCAGWRNSRAVGYQGVSVRSIIQRQSKKNGMRIHTGLAIAPARCATEVSEERRVGKECRSRWP